MYMCLECGKKFVTTRSAERACYEGCPKCGGSDIDLATKADIDRIRAERKASKALAAAHASY